MRTFNYSEVNNLGLERQKQLEEKWYSIEMLKAFRRNIQKVSPEKAQELGEKLLNIISSKNYINNENIAEPTQLIFAGADFEFRNVKNGDTSLIVCSKKNLYNTFSLLVKAGANTNAQNAFLSTAVMWSARKGFNEILGDLILLQANLNLHCADGDTALLSAVRHNQLKSAQLLVKAGVILTAQNNLGEDAMLVAKANGYYEIAKLISDHLSEEQYNFNDCTFDVVNDELEIARQKLKSLWNKK